MVTAIILLRCERRSITQVAEKLAGTDGIAEVYSVAGNFDLVAIVRVAHNDDLADLVTRNLNDVDGITHTETLIAFRAFSKHDLEVSSPSECEARLARPASRLWPAFQCWSITRGSGIPSLSSSKARGVG